MVYEKTFHARTYNLVPTTKEKEEM